MVSFEIVRIVDRRVQTSVVRADDSLFERWHPDTRNQVAFDAMHAAIEDAYDYDVPTMIRLLTRWDGEPVNGTRHINRAWRRFHGMIGD